VQNKAQNRWLNLIYVGLASKCLHSCEAKQNPLTSETCLMSMVIRYDTIR